MRISSTVLLLVLFLNTQYLAVGQDQDKIDSILAIIDNTDIDTVKARLFLEISDLTMYNDPEMILEFLLTAEELYRRNNYPKGEARLYAQKANYYYRQGNIDSARYYLSSSVEKSQQIGDSLRAAVIRHNIGILDHYQGNSENASQIMEENIPVFERYGDSLHLANAYLLVGKIAISDGFFNIALSESFKSLKIHRSLGDDFRIAEALIQIGIIYQTTEEYDKSINIFGESIEYYEKSESMQSIAQVLNYMADSKIKLGQYASANEDLDKALDFSEKLEYTANIARVYYNKGVLSFAEGDYVVASRHFQTSLETWRKVGSPNNEANALYYLGRCHSRLGGYAKAIDFLNQSIDIARSLNYPEILSKSYLEQSLAQEAISNYQDALGYYKKSKTLSDSIFTIKRTQATQELKTIYETEKKEQQLALREQEIKVLEQEASIGNLQRLLLGIGLLLSIIAFYALRQKMKRNRLEKEKVEADLAFKKRELTTHALHLAKKNEVLENVKKKAQELNKVDAAHGYQKLIQTINFDQQDDQSWENFTQYFEQVHKDFATNVNSRYPNVTKNELRLMALLKMNMSSKEIANILNISPDGIKKARQRLRKKLELAPSDSLEGAVLAI